MYRAVFCWALFLVGVLGAQPGRAQTKPAAPAPQKVLTVRVALPTVLGQVGELVGLLPRRPKDKNRAPTSNPVVTLAVPLPRLLSGSSSSPTPAKP